MWAPVLAQSGSGRVCHTRAHSRWALTPARSRGLYGINALAPHTRPVRKLSPIKQRRRLRHPLQPPSCPCAPLPRRRPHLLSPQPDALPPLPHPPAPGVGQGHQAARATRGWLQRARGDPGVSQSRTPTGTPHRALDTPTRSQGLVARESDPAAPSSGGEAAWPASPAEPGTVPDSARPMHKPRSLPLWRLRWGAMRKHSQPRT